ncbi:MAG: decarboxylating 6-phosphogluconate dehydrogenase [bacterium]|nr:decarboxylating 6-phosphogluconate dehydrogenase [bacterium]
MQIGYIGLGKMGKNMVFNMLDHGHKVVAWNRSPAPLDEVVAAGAERASTPKNVIEKLNERKVIWLMLTAGDVTEDMLFGSQALVTYLQKGDVIIDGGNSNFNDTKRRAEKCAELGIHFLDSGTSGGPGGARNGACLMIGGDKDVFEDLRPLFESLSVVNGYKYVGPSGSGHFVKMVHNAVEYGFLQAMGEGFELIKLGPYKDLNLGEIADIWNSGSIIQSKLMMLAEDAFKEDNDLSSVRGYIEDNGEAQWSVETALQYKVPLTTLAHALFVRYRSRQDDSFAAKVVAVLRNRFGGHAVKNN